MFVNQFLMTVKLSADPWAGGILGLLGEFDLRLKISNMANIFRFSEYYLNILGYLVFRNIGCVKLIK